MAKSAVPYPIVGLASAQDSVVLASSSDLHLVNPSGPSSSTHSIPGSSTSSAFIRQIAISPDSKYAATISDDKGLRIYSLPSGSDSKVIKLESTRYLTKKASDLSFVPETNDILVSDKVGDCYLYPLLPKDLDLSAEKLKKLDVQADPTLNPEATFLLGHVSVLTSHIFTEDRKHVITADRDEHIRITRYPDTFVIERYLFGTDGFVSSIHIPVGHPDILISGGGEGILRIWDWKQGKQVGSVDLGAEILPHRAVRSTLRKDKRKNKASKRSDDPFYDVPEGWMLPSGQGFCIKRITSLRIADQTLVLFFSEGASAIHSFILPADISTSSSSKISTLPIAFPVLDYTSVPGTSDQILVSLDTTFGTVAFNQEAGQQKPKKDTELTEDQREGAKKQFMILQIGFDGSFTDITSSSPLLSTLQSLSTYPEVSGSNPLSQLNLYPNLSLYPRWPGLEEDDDLAGPALEASNQAQDGGEASPALAPLGSSKSKKEYTRSEYETMNLKTLGRLKAQGYDVESVMKVKRRETKDRRMEAKRRRLDAGLTEPSKEEEELVAEEKGDEEEGGNA